MPLFILNKIKLTQMPSSPEIDTCGILSIGSTHGSYMPLTLHRARHYESNLTTSASFLISGPARFTLFAIFER